MSTPEAYPTPKSQDESHFDLRGIGISGEDAAHQATTTNLIKALETAKKAGAGDAPVEIEAVQRTIGDKV